MKLGVVGLPNVGKSTLFNAITGAQALSLNYPFCTIEPNVGIVDVADSRLNVLASMNNSKQIIPACIEFVDIAGLVKGASKGEGLGNKFLSNIREVDAIVHVVRCFENPLITHVNGVVNPKDDIETINLELILSDLESVQKRLDKGIKQLKQGGKDIELEVSLLKRIEECLTKEKPARSLSLTAEEVKLMKSFFLLTSKPIIYVANVSEQMITCPDNDFVLAVKKIASEDNSECVVISARIEEELISLNSEEREEFKKELGLKESGLDKLVKVGYFSLGLISYLTSGEKETRAWTIKRGTKAPQAAGVIHTDFEKGFIKAEVVSYSDLVTAGSFVKAKEKGKINLVGKEYIMQDGDVVVFKFNV